MGKNHQESNENESQSLNEGKGGGGMNMADFFKGVDKKDLMLAFTDPEKAMEKNGTGPASMESEHL